MRERGDAVRGQMRLQAVAIIAFDDVKMIHVLIFRGRVRQAQRRIGERGVIDARDRAALGAPFVHFAQLHAQHGGVQIVQAAVVANAVVRALERAVIAQFANLRGQFRVAGGHGAAIAEAAQIFLDNEAETNRVAVLADGEIIAARADALRAILNHRKAVSFGNFRYRRHVRRQAVEMHGHDGARFRRDRGSQFANVEIMRLAIGIDQHRRRAGQPDGLGRGEKCVRSGDDLVARPEAQR